MVLCRSLRDAQTFGYSSLSKLAKQGDKLVASGLQKIAQFPDAANGS